MILLVFGFFAVLFGAALLLGLEEVLAQVQSRVRTHVAVLAISRRRQTKAEADCIVKPAPVQDAQKTYNVQTWHSEAANNVVQETRSEPQSPVCDDLSAAESSCELDTDSEDEPTDEMMYHASMVTADHAFCFPRVGISICVRPPPTDEDYRGRKTAARASPRSRSSQQRDLLRVHEGYMFIEDRVLRFKTNGDREKKYEAWHESKWRQAKRHEIWVQNNERGEAECVALICVLDRSNCWTPLRVRESDWIECA